MYLFQSKNYYFIGEEANRTFEQGRLLVEKPGMNIAEISISKPETRRTLVKVLLLHYFHTPILRSPYIRTITGYWFVLTPSFCRQTGLIDTLTCYRSHDRIGPVG